MTSFIPNYPNQPTDDPSAQQFLEDHQIKMIDEALRSLGEYGEVRLVVEKGRLRFVVTQRSYDALKWKPGSLELEGT